jgi:hypothetical protein
LARRPLLERRATYVRAGPYYPLRWGMTVLVDFVDSEEKERGEKSTALS